MLGAFGPKLHCARRASIIQMDEGMNRVGGSQKGSDSFSQRKARPPTGGHWWPWASASKESGPGFALEAGGHLLACQGHQGGEAGGLVTLETAHPSCRCLLEEGAAEARGFQVFFSANMFVTSMILYEHVLRCAADRLVAVVCYC